MHQAAGSVSVLATVAAKAESQALNLRRIEGDYQVRIQSETSGGEAYTADNELRIVLAGITAVQGRVPIAFIREAILITLFILSGD